MMSMRITNGNLKLKQKTKASNKDKETISYYMELTKKYPILTREEEVKYAKLYVETKNKKYSDILANANLRFVAKVAYKYAGLGFPMEDLIQEGNTGLMMAIHKFEPDRGIRLISYAVWWIKAQIHKYIVYQWSMVKAGTTTNQRKIFYTMVKKRQQLEAILGRDSTSEELAQELGVPVKEFIEMEHRMSHRDVSLDSPTFGADRDTPLLDFIDSEIESQSDIAERNELVEKFNEQIRKVKRQLNDRQKVILKDRLLAENPRTLEDLGEEFDVSRERARQLETAIVKKIKAQLEEGAFV